MLIDDFHNFNYLEINILKNKILQNNNTPNNKSSNIHNNDNNIIDINWDENTFNNTLINFINNKRYKPFEKRLKILKYNDLYLIYNINDKKYYVNRTSYINHDINENYIWIKYKKENLPQISFPSTNNINEKYYINKITVKITNRIYINFGLKKKIENHAEEIYSRVYINFNNDKNDKVDNDNINNLLNKSINYF